jgi:nucleotide-binding universal stress UspA family protein
VETVEGGSDVDFQKKNWKTGVHQYLEKFLKDFASPHLEVKHRIETCTSPAAGILATSKQEGADLIVMGTHGRSGYDRMLTGSVTNKVLHKSPVPVLTVCKPTRNFLPESPQVPLHIKNILCAVDPVHANLKMKNLALAMARSFQSTLFFVEVEEFQGQESSLKNLEGLIQPEREDWSTVKFLKESGDPIEKLLMIANSHEIDLMIIGHHTQHPPEWEILGSVAYMLVPQSPCPVLVVRNPQ